MAEQHTDQIDWDEDTFEITDRDVDGSGQCHDGLIRGYIHTPTEMREYSAHASICCGEIEVDETTVELVDVCGKGEG